MILAYREKHAKKKHRFKRFRISSQDLRTFLILRSRAESLLIYIHIEEEEENGVVVLELAPPKGQDKSQNRNWFEMNEANKKQVNSR